MRSALHVDLTRFLGVAFAVLAGAPAGCAHADLIPGTTVVNTEENRAVLEVVEKYRTYLQDKNIEGLTMLASQKYFEDSGTPRADDDYGYEGLRSVLAKRLARVRAVRYEIEYRRVRIKGSRAEVEVFLNGAFELASESGDRYRRVNDYHHFMLDQSDGKWRFVSGM